MKILVIGAVAAGTSAAAKARRNSEDAEIVIFEKDSIFSYSGCGMPYFIGGEVKTAEELTPRDSAFFKSKYNIDIKTQHEVLAIQPETKTVDVKNLSTGEIFADCYDRLIIATGAKPIAPPIKGTDRYNVFTLRNIGDMLRIKRFIDDTSPKSAVIIGTGFIGLELCDNLKRLGMDVTLVERLPQIMPGLDSDMAVYVKEHIEKNGVSVYVDTIVTEITEKNVILSNGRKKAADMIFISTGVRPETALAKAAGISIGENGAIKVTPKMQTNIEDIYACGDCIEQLHLVTGKPVYRPLGSTANKTGRIAGDAVTGGTLEFRGILGTGIFKLFDMTVAQTGLSEKEAIKQGFEVQVCHINKPDKPDYMGGSEMIIKGIADKMNGRLIGVQIVGQSGVDKRIDVFATAITFGAKAEDLFHLDLAYAPPFSTTKDPVMYTGMVLDNAISKGRLLMTAAELDVLMHTGEHYQLIDARTAAQYENGHIGTAENIPHEKLRAASDTLDKSIPAVTYCNKGVTGNAAQNILLNKGFQKVYNLSGGHKHYKMNKKQGETI